MTTKYKLIAFLSVWAFSQSSNALDLVETYQIAVKNSPQLRGSLYAKNSVAESKSQAIGQMLPTLSLSANSSWNRLNNEKTATFRGGGVQKYWDHGFSINLNQPLFHWDHWVQLEQSDNRIAVAEADYQAAIQTLMVSTTEAYFNIIAAQDNLVFTLAEQKAIERQLDQAKERYNVGLNAITSVHEAQAAFDDARANQIDAENELNRSKEALIEIIGESDIELDRVENAVNFTYPKPNDIKHWVKNAETNNLSLIAALNQAEVRRKDISLEQARHLPVVDIVAAYNMQDVNSSFGLRGDTENIGIRINIPIFQGGTVNSRVRASEYDYRAAKEELLRTKRQVTRQTRNAFRDVAANLSRVSALKASVSSAASAVEATQAGFVVGTRTMVDVLSEQRNLYRTKRNLSRSRYDYLINGVKLKQAVGNLTEADLVQINQYLGRDLKID
ncbi:MAG: TolC family outer membrane protein [Methylococcales bacterium]|nr:TolC family outer membrane protein [Methylococcales bacterium]